MEKYEQAEFERAMYGELVRTRGLSKDDRIQKIARVGKRWMDDQGFETGINLALYDPNDGHITQTLEGKEAITYSVVASAVGMIEDESHYTTLTEHRPCLEAGIIMERNGVH